MQLGQVGNDDLAAAQKRAIETAAEFTRDGTLLSFADARAGARAALLAERREAAVREWVAGLRRRIEVNVLYLPGR